MDKDKQRQEISLIGRLLSMEVLLVLMGALSLISGILAHDVLRLFLGVIILSALALFIILRRRRRRINMALEQAGKKHENRNV